MDPEVNDYPELRMAEMPKALFNRQFLSDVQFRVDGQIIYAHSLILMMRSTVFQHQFKGTMNDIKLIPISDVTYYCFYQFISFIYTDECDVGKENVIDLCKLAKRYRIIRLTNFVIGCVNGYEINLSLFEFCLLHNDEIHLRRLQIILQQHLQGFIRHDRFLTLHPKAVEEILKFDCVDISEYELFWALARWIDQNETNHHIRMQPHDYGKLISLIRFPVMANNELYSWPVKHPKMFATNYPTSFLKVFETFKRDNILWRKRREFGNKKRDWVTFSKDNIFMTKFCVTHDTLLIGLTCGNDRNNKSAKLIITEMNNQMGIMQTLIINCTSSKRWSTDVVNLGESIRLKPKMNYTMAFKYCTTNEETIDVMCRLDDQDFYTNMPTELVQFDEIGVNIFDMIFKKPTYELLIDI